MNITILGATGMVGTRLVAEAVARDHRVTATSRTSDSRPDARVTSIRLDASSHDQLHTALHPADVAILTIRAASGQESTLAPLTRTVLDVAAATGTRLLVIGGAGPLRTPRDPGKRVIDDPEYVPEAYRPVAAASVAQLRACEEHSHRNWTYLSPPAVLQPGERTGSYRRGGTTLLTGPDGRSRISAEDLAVAALDEIEGPRGERHVTVVEARGSAAAPR